MKQRPKVIVIGGGAAGFFGAITCAIANPYAKVTLLEAGRKPLAKVRISGGGRCNVTHHCFDPRLLVQNYPRGGKALRGAFTRFQPQDTVAWFAAHGVRLKTEADGRMFPLTDNSQTIVNCLIEAAQQAGVEIYTGNAVKSVVRLSEGFQVTSNKGKSWQGDYLLIATGSNPSGYRWAKDLGHQIISPVPSLFTFNINDPRLQNLAGVSLENVQLRLLSTQKPKLEQTGSLLITHWGLSGPAVLKLSAWGARVLHDCYYQLPLQINWLPPHNLETIRLKLQELKSQMSRRQIFSSSPFPLPKRFWQRLVTTVGITDNLRWAQLPKSTLNKLANELTQGRYQIQGKGIFKEEFVTCGGINLKEVNFKTMESRLCPGLFFAGEILDLDGITGGFNFQSAWTTGWLAGQTIGK